MTNIKGGDSKNYDGFEIVREGAARVEKRNETRVVDGVCYLAEERYWKVAKMLDGFTRVRKDVSNRNIIYSPAGLNPDLKVRAINEGNIIINNSERTIKISEDIKLAEGLEDKLIKLILVGN